MSQCITESFSLYVRLVLFIQKAYQFIFTSSLLVHFILPFIELDPAPIYSI